MKVCSLFSGIGGIDIAFKQAGFDIIWANDFDEFAAKTYRYNLGSNELVVKNIKQIKVNSIPEFDILVAGFPCQPFSSIGMKKGFDDTRGVLFFEIVRIVKEKLPKVIFLENVANLLGHDDGKTFLTIYNAIVPFGYSFKYQVMDALDYGNLPQRRSRLFIVAFLDELACERFTFPDKVKRTIHLNDIIIRDKQHDITYYIDNSDKNYSKLSKIVANKSLIYRFYDSIDVHKAYRICPTLLASMGKFQDTIPLVIDNYGIRRITPYECLGFLGFPKEYRFPNIPMANAYKQCGNSVAVPVVKRIADAIKQALRYESL